MKKISKFSDTSIRVLETLKMLVDKKASIQDIINHFEKIDPNNRIYTNEVILKYINTLKVFGFKFVKEKDKYVILNKPNQFDFNKNDLRALSILDTISKSVPEVSVKEESQLLFQEIEKRFSQNTRNITNSVDKISFSQSELFKNENGKMLKEIEKICTDNQKIKISILDEQGQETSFVAEPKEIKYIKNEIYFSIYIPSEANIKDANIKKITSIVQLPIRTNQNIMLSTTTFKLKNRLAKAYKLHESEKMLQVENDGSIIILNTAEDRNMLLRRLMRYGPNCVVISPKTVKEEMKNLINKTLENYR